MQGSFGAALYGRALTAAASSPPLISTVWNCLLFDAFFVAKTMRSAPMTYGIQSPRLIICLQEAVGRFS